MPIFLLPLLKWLSGFIEGPLLDHAVTAWKAKLDSNNTADQHTADLAIREMALEQREAELASAERIAEDGSWLNRWIRPGFAWPFIIFNAKLILWDTMLGRGTTPELSAHLLSIEGIVIAFYFGGRTIEKVASRLSTVLDRKASKS